MYAVIAINLLGSTVAATVQSLISSAADSRSQGQMLGAANSLSSLTAVFAPMVAAPLLAMVSHLPQGDWRIGTPFYFCAALQLAALAMAVMHFRSHRAAVRTA